MKHILPVLLFLPFLAACSSSELTTKSDNEMKEYSKKLAENILIADTHFDTPMLLMEGKVDFSQSTPSANFDYPRAKAGGLKAPFWAAFISPEFNFSDKAKKYADDIISAVEKFCGEHTDKFQMVRTPLDVMENYSKGKILIAMGIENGAAIEDSLSNIKHFYDRGIRYITLTHSTNNKICDSSFDPTRKWNGLSPFGVEVVKEMNRIGVIIDVSHASDSTFYQVIRLSKAPIVATHSACRYFTPGLERNMSDEMIKLLAKKGGVIQINFGSVFLNREIMEQQNTNKIEINKYFTEHNLKRSDPEAREFYKKYFEEHPQMYADVKDIAAHIDHVVKLVGIDFVGIGSDFDGLGDSLPTGMKDVSGYPNLIYELMKLGYSDDDIQKVMGGNFMRVWRKVELSAK
jgi:membrane dipeptidase